jgi:hypothetical protein
MFIIHAFNCTLQGVIMNRRKFIASSSFALAASSLPTKLFGGFMQELSDEQICTAKFAFAVSNKLYDLPLNEVIVEIGKSFIGTDYASNTLEDDGPEKLVINLHTLDCVTFYENCLTLARCIKMKKTTFAEYKAQLQFLRYRNGIIDGYASRLHYTTDYFFNAEQKGILKVVTKDIADEKNLAEIPKPINFMTTHRDKYKHIATNSENFAKIQAMEAEINKRKDYFLPKGNLHMFEGKVEHGSILGITTNMEGMDISHTGVAVQQNGRLYFMHAPITGKKVQITDVPMHDYLAKNAKQTGIIVAKPLEVKS